MNFVSVLLFGFAAFAPFTSAADFWVSIASFKNLADAKTALIKVNSESSEDFKLLGAATAKGYFYRLVVGPHATLQHALDAQSALETSELGGGWIWQSSAAPPEYAVDTEIANQEADENHGVELAEIPGSSDDLADLEGAEVATSEGDHVNKEFAYDSNQGRGREDEAIDFDTVDFVGADQREATSAAVDVQRSIDLPRDDNLLIDSALIRQVGDEGRVRRTAIESAVSNRPRPEVERANTKIVEPLIRRQRLSFKRSRPESEIERVNIADAPKFPIDVEFANVPIDVAAQMLSEIIGKNIILGSEVEGNLNLAFYGVPWDVALATILSVKGLAQYEDKSTGIIRWHEPRVLDKWLEAEVKRSEGLRRQELANRTITPTETEIFRLFYSDPEAVKQQLEEIFNSGSSNERSSSVSNIGSAGRLLADASGGRFKDAGTLIDIAANSTHRQLIVRASEEDLNLIAQLIEQIDQPAQQVMIEAFIVEVTDDFESQLGSRLSLDRTDGSGDYRVRTAGTLTGANDEDESGLSLASSSGTLFDLSAPGANTALGFLLDGARLKVELSALEQDGYSRTISSPRLLAFDNEEATIFQGIQVPYTTVSNDGTQTEFKEAGLKLSVTPSVIGDGRLILSVTVNQDTVETTRDNPPITTREISTRLSVDDGGMAVLGGIYLQQESAADSRVPVLGKVPVLGRMFKSKQSREGRRELLIFIVPTII